MRIRKENLDLGDLGRAKVAYGVDLRSKGKGGRGYRQVTTGALLIAAGVLLFMVQQDIIEIRSIWRYWPVPWLVLGLMKLVAPPEERDLAGGTFEIALGAWFLACNLHWFGFTYRQTWPLIFVAIGLSQVIKALGGGPRAPVAAPTPVKEDGHA